MTIRAQPRSFRIEHVPVNVDRGMVLVNIPTIGDQAVDGGYNEASRAKSNFGGCLVKLSDVRRLVVVDRLLHISPRYGDAAAGRDCSDLFTGVYDLDPIRRR